MVLPTPLIFPSSMPTSDFWSRMREGRLVRVLAVYLAVCWIVLIPISAMATL